MWPGGVSDGNKHARAYERKKKNQAIGGCGIDCVAESKHVRRGCVIRKLRPTDSQFKPHAAIITGFFFTDRPAFALSSLTNASGFT